MLTAPERTAIRTKCERLSLKGLEDLAVHCVRENRQDAAKYVRDIIAEREIRYRASTVPFEISGRTRQQQQVQVEQPRIEYPQYWTPERVRYAVYSVGGIAGIGAGIYYVVIPAVVALFSAVISAVSVAAPYVAGGIFVLIVLRESFFGEKKTGYFPAESPKPSGGNVYNIYVGEGQNVHVHSGGKK